MGLPSTPLPAPQLLYDCISNVLLGKTLPGDRFHGQLDAEKPFGKLSYSYSLRLWDMEAGVDSTQSHWIRPLENKRIWYPISGSCFQHDFYYGCGGGRFVTIYLHADLHECSVDSL